MIDLQVYPFNKCKDYGDIFDFLSKKSYILIALFFKIFLDGYTN